MDCPTDDTIISSSEMVLYEPSKRVRRILRDKRRGLRGTQFDILMVCSLDCDRCMSKQIFNFNVLDELQNVST